MRHLSSIRVRSTLQFGLFRCAVLWVLLLFAERTYGVAQEIHVSTPTNVDCSSAVPFCGPIIFTYDHYPAGATCLWFSFTVTSAQTVCIQAHDHKAHFIPASGEEACVCPTTGGGDVTINTPLGAGTYYLVFEINTNTPRHIEIAVECGLQCGTVECEGCLPSFLPMAGDQYIVTAWVKKENASPGTVDYSQPPGQSPYIHLEAPAGTPLIDVYPSIEIPVIEGWQQIQGTFTMPGGAGSFALYLRVGSGSALFDDVRILPADGSMKCYVYDPQNLRFTAELDERHFATFYEYDYEGKLVRVKKETERGIMTIQESRQNAAH